MSKELDSPEEDSKKFFLGVGCRQNLICKFGTLTSNYCFLNILSVCFPKLVLSDFFPFLVHSLLEILLVFVVLYDFFKFIFLLVCDINGWHSNFIEDWEMTQEACEGEFDSDKA